jgi:hypothetical protein
MVIDQVLIAIAGLFRIRILHNIYFRNLTSNICLLQKNRKMIPCYWENQPGGCRKPHCSFQHKNPREPPTVADMEKAKEC